MASRPVSLALLRGALCVLPLALPATSAEAALRVVAALPDVGDMARQIGGDRVEVVALASGSQDLAAGAAPRFDCGSDRDG